MGGGCWEGVRFGFGFGLALYKKELLFNCLGCGSVCMGVVLVWLVVAPVVVGWLVVDPYEFGCMGKGKWVFKVLYFWFCLGVGLVVVVLCNGVKGELGFLGLIFLGWGYCLGWFRWWVVCLE